MTTLSHNGEVIEGGYQPRPPGFEDRWVNTIIGIPVNFQCTVERSYPEHSATINWYIEGVPAINDPAWVLLSEPLESNNPDGVTYDVTEEAQIITRRDQSPGFVMQCRGANRYGSYLAHLFVDVFGK